MKPRCESPNDCGLRTLQSLGCHAVEHHAALLGCDGALVCRLESQAGSEQLSSHDVAGSRAGCWCGGASDGWADVAAEGSPRGLGSIRAWLLGGWVRQHRAVEADREDAFLRSGGEMSIADVGYRLPSRRKAGSPGLARNQGDTQPDPIPRLPNRKSRMSRYSRAGFMRLGAQPRLSARLFGWSSCSGDATRCAAITRASSMGFPMPRAGSITRNRRSFGVMT